SGILFPTLEVGDHYTISSVVTGLSVVGDFFRRGSRFLSGTAGRCRCPYRLPGRTRPALLQFASGYLSTTAGHHGLCLVERLRSIPCGPWAGSGCACSCDRDARTPVAPGYGIPSRGTILSRL